MKKLIYIANARIPTEKAHGYQMVTMCERFAELGQEVIMLAPLRRNQIHEDAFSFYKVRPNFRIVYLACPDFVEWGKIGFVLTTWIFSLRAAVKTLRLGPGLVYTRDGRVLWVLSWFNRTGAWEIHDDERFWWAKRVLRRATSVVTTNRALAQIHEQFAGSKLSILVAPNGMDPDSFPKNKTKEELRKELGLDPQRSTILYTGHLYAYKGVDTLAEAAREIPDCDFVFVGGTEVDIKRFTKQYQKISNLCILGHKPHEQIPLYLASADILILPNSAKDVFSTLYTSPIKLFEYIGSGVPIIASDLPSIKEVVNDQDVFFFHADNKDDLVRVIRYAVGHPHEAKEKAQASLEKAREYTWLNRARRITDFITRHHVVA